MIINHNMSALYVWRKLYEQEHVAERERERLSSGIRINSAKDDASGLAVSEKMAAQIRGMNQASTNAENALSLVQTTEGFLEETGEILGRIRVLAIQAANGIYTREDRLYMNIEVSELIDEIDRIASHAQFNGMNLLTGRFASETGNNSITASMWFHIGANPDQRIRLYISTLTSRALGIRDNAGSNVADLSSIETANKTIGAIDSASEVVDILQGVLGAISNRLENTVKGLDQGSENLQAAESIIRDQDMAEGVVQSVKNEIIEQAGTVMLTQANLYPERVLQLLG